MERGSRRAPPLSSDLNLKVLQNLLDLIPDDCRNLVNGLLALDDKGTLRKYFPESSTPREMEEKIIGLLEESKTEKVVFRSDSIKKYFPSNYSSEQIENSILKMLDQRMKKRKHEAER